VVRPGITGWAQVQYKYGNTMEDAREKLQYDLFYIKNASVGLDLLILFHTIKIVLLGRGRNDLGVLAGRHRDCIRLRGLCGLVVAASQVASVASAARFH